MKASFQSCQPLKKGNMSVFSFTYILVASSSLLSYPSSPAQGCVSAEEQVYHRTRLKEKKKKKDVLCLKKQRFFAKWFVKMPTGREKLLSSLSSTVALSLPPCAAAVMFQLWTSGGKEHLCAPSVWCQCSGLLRAREPAGSCSFRGVFMDHPSQSKPALSTFPFNKYHLAQKQ